MMRLFSSRRESITADLRARAARFEQHYGRKPSQRELAYGLARIDRPGRVADRTVTGALGWRGGDRLVLPACDLSPSARPAAAVAPGALTGVAR